MEQKENKTPEIISWTVDPDGNARFLIFMPSEYIEKKQTLSLNDLTTACLEQAHAADPTINYVPERKFVIGWTGLNTTPTTTGPVDLDGVVIRDWKGIQHHLDIDPDTHVLRSSCGGDLNGLLELQGVNISVERVVTHIEQA